MTLKRSIQSQAKRRIQSFTYIEEGLVSSDRDGEIVPGLAESWVFSEDSKQLTFTLRENLKWSDGEPLTVDDVLFTYNDIYLNEKIPTDFRDLLKIGKDKKLPTITKVDQRRGKIHYSRALCSVSSLYRHWAHA